MRMSKRSISLLQLFFVAVIMIGLVIPFAGMSFARTDSTSENRNLAEMPEFIEDGHVNVNYLSEAGTYFEDRYAFKEILVNLDAEFNVGLFHNSVRDDVIIGTEGWLYYGPTKTDYVGIDQMTNKQLGVLAYNISLLQSYVEGRDVQFMVTIAPNKNTVYPEYMPERFLKSDSPHNMDRFEAYAEAAGIEYVNLAPRLCKEAEKSSIDLYYLRDTHWNAYGAAIGYDELMDRANIPHREYGEDSIVYGEEEGDLWDMLYSGDDGALIAPQSLAIDGLTHKQLSEANPKCRQVLNNDPYASGQCLIIGDSFSEALADPMGSAFDTLTFIRLAGTVEDLEKLINEFDPNLFMFERVERAVSTMADPTCVKLAFPSLEAPVDATSLTRETAEAPSIVATLESCSDEYVRLSGHFEETSLFEDKQFGTQLVLVVEQPDGSRQAYLPYRANPLGGVDGFIAYFHEDGAIDDDCTVELFEVFGDTSTCVATATIGEKVQE